MIRKSEQCGGVGRAIGRNVSVSGWFLLLSYVLDCIAFAWFDSQIGNNEMWPNFSTVAHTVDATCVCATWQRSGSVLPVVFLHAHPTHFYNEKKTRTSVCRRCKHLNERSNVITLCRSGCLDDAAGANRTLLLLDLSTLQKFPLDTEAASSTKTGCLFVAEICAACRDTDRMCY